MPSQPESIHLLLIDALNLVRRVYAAQPGEDGPERAEGAATSCVHSLQRALRECEPTHAVCVFEGEGRSWRHERFAGYKAGHTPMPAPLARSLPQLEADFRGVGVASIDYPEHEADDVVATLAVKVAGRGERVTILSTDKIFLQLLGPRIEVRDHFARKSLNEDYVQKRFGVRPEHLIELLALAGDSTNAIPGVPGVGPKTAARLLAEHGSLDSVLDEADSIAGKTGERLREHAADARLARDLVTLRTDLDLGGNLQDFRVDAS